MNSLNINLVVAHVRRVLGFLDSVEHECTNKSRAKSTLRNIEVSREDTSFIERSAMEALVAVNMALNNHLVSVAKAVPEGDRWRLAESLMQLSSFVIPLVEGLNPQDIVSVNQGQKPREDSIQI